MCGTPTCAVNQIGRKIELVDVFRSKLAKSMPTNREKLAIGPMNCPAKRCRHTYTRMRYEKSARGGEGAGMEDLERPNAPQDEIKLR